MVAGPSWRFPWQSVGGGAGQLHFAESTAGDAGGGGGWDSSVS